MRRAKYSSRVYITYIFYKYSSHSRGSFKSYGARDFFVGKKEFIKAHCI